MTKKGHQILRTMTKMVVNFFQKNRVTPAVTTPGDQP